MSLVAMAMVWYVPGWLRTHTPQSGVTERLENMFPSAKVEFRAWDGDRLQWRAAVANADAYSAKLADEIAALTDAERAELTLVGHSLGGRIVVRTLARLGARGLKIKCGVAMAAAIPYTDGDIARMSAGAALPVIAVCNPDDVTLKYVYAVFGGETDAAFGANGAGGRSSGVKEYVIPAEIVHDTPIEDCWAKLPVAREVANHHAHFYLAALARILDGEPLSDQPMVLQHFVSVKWPVIDAGVWWRTLDTHQGWKLEQNKLTTHVRILDPDRRRRAWGALAPMRRSFDKLKGDVRE